MKKDNYKNIILDHHDVKNKIKRISLEILEDNIDQKKLIFFESIPKPERIIQINPKEFSITYISSPFSPN